MRVTGTQTTVFNRLHSMFPMQRKPGFGYTDFIGEHGVSGLPQLAADGQTIVIQNDRIQLDAMIGAVHPRSIFVPHDNLIFQGGYQVGSCNHGRPVVRWRDLTILPGTPSGCSTWFINQPGSIPHCGVVFITWTNTWVENLVTAIADLAPKCHGFTFYLGVHPDSAYSDRSHFAMRFRTTEGGEAGRWYSISLHVARGVLFGYNDTVTGSGDPDESAWVYVADFLPLSGSNVLMTGEQITSTACTGTPPVPQATVQWDRLHRIDVLFLGGLLRVSVGGEMTPFVFPHFKQGVGQDPQALIDRISIRSYNNHCGFFSAHPTKWETTASLISHEEDLGFVPEPSQVPSFTTHYIPNYGRIPVDPTQVGYHPAGHTAAAFLYDQSGTTLRYRLGFTNPQTGTFQGRPYADFTSAVKAVSVLMPGVAHSVVGLPQNQYPEEIDIWHTFDFQHLTVQSRAALRFNNFHGTWSNDNDTGWVDTHGHIGVQVDLGVSGFLQYRRFSGIGNTDFEEQMLPGGQSHVTIHCCDGWLPLEVPIWNVPWMDGWNIHYALYYLAQRGGVTDSRIGFLSKVPSNRYGPNPDGSPSFYLPVGAAGTPLTRFTGGQQIRQIMHKIAISVGYMLFFDVFGVLQFAKFQIPFGGPYTKTFTHVATDSVSQRLTEVWSGQRMGSLRETRNTVTIIGVNALGPLWHPVVAHAADAASIYDDSAGNFKGYNDPLVWSDNIFANKAFAASAAAELLAFLRLRTETLNLTTWFQPDRPLNPLDLIRIDYPKSGATGKNFLVLATHDHLRQGEPPTTQITGRFVPGS